MSASPATGPGPSRGALVLAYATIYLIWGSTYLGIRVAVDTMPPFAMAACRFFLAGLILYAFLRMRGTPAPTRVQWRCHGIIGTFLLLGGNGLVCWAEQEVPSGIAALIVAVGPVFTVLVEWLWPGGTRPVPLTFAGLALGIAGVTYLMAPWEALAESPLPAAELTGLLGACFLWSVGSIYARHNQAGASALMAAAMQMIVGGLMLGVTATVMGEWPEIAWSRISADSIVAFVYLVTMGSLVGFCTFAWLVRNSRPALVATYAYVNPIVAVALGALVLDEPVSSRLAIAAALIIASVVLISIGRSRPRTS